MLRKQKRREDLEACLLKEQIAEEETAASGVRKTMDVEAALDVLPEIMRSVVVLNVYQGLKYHGLAEVLDIPVGTVKSRLHRALMALKDILSGMLGDEFVASGSR